jgi:hypothetical protein
MLLATLSKYRFQIFSPTTEQSVHEEKFARPLVVRAPTIAIGVVNARKTIASVNSAEAISQALIR